MYGFEWLKILNKRSFMSKKPHQNTPTLPILGISSSSRGFRKGEESVSIEPARFELKATDVVVSCDDRDRSARDFLQYPCLIAEVLSPSTEGRDRGIKQRNYMQIDTLQTYIVIDPDRPIVETYQRHDRAWEYISTAIEGTSFASNDPLIQIASLGLEFSLSLLYENIDFANSETTNQL